MTKFKWRRNYGDGECTDDSVLWVNGKPTENIVSPWSGVFSAYYNGKEIGIFDTRKEAQDYIIERINQ